MTTFNDINWKSMRSSFGRLTKGQQFQLAKFTHNWTPTLHQCATKTTVLIDDALPAEHGERI
jgi:hypothetical protein